MSGSRYRVIVSSSQLRVLFPALLASAFGDGMTAVAIPLLALQSVHGSGRSSFIGLCVASYTVPGILPVVFCRKWLSRLRAPVIVRSDAVLRGIGLGAITVLDLAHALRPSLLVVALGVSSLLHSWGSAGRYAIVAEALAEDAARQVGNAVLSGFDQMATIVGPVMAGLLITAGNASVPIGCDALSFVILAAATLAPAFARLPAATGPSPDLADFSLRRMLEDRVIAALLVLTYLYFFLYGPLEVALPLLVVDRLHGSATELGLFWTAFGVFAVLGAALGSRVPARLLWTVAIGSVIGWGAVMVPMGWVHSVPPALCLFGLGGLLYAPYPIVSYTILQRRAERGTLLPVLAVRSGLTLVASPVGAAVGGPVTGAVGVGPTFAISGVATLAVGVAAGGWHVARRKRPSDVSGSASGGAGPAALDGDGSATASGD